MKRCPHAHTRDCWPAVLLAVFAVALVPVPASGQTGGTYDLTWNTADGGGGTVTGGKFSLSFTVGQHDTGGATGGTFAFRGGYWAALGAVGGESGAPLPASPPHDIRKNRVISINPNNTDPVVMRVELLACSTAGDPCTNDVDCDEGETCSPTALLGWVSDPITLGAASQLPEGSTVARVVNVMPTPRVWTESLVHISDCEIAPVQGYAISASTDGLVFSEPLRIGTINKPGKKNWADYVSTVESGVFTPPNGILNVNDLSALLAFFQGRTVSDLEYVVTTLELVDETTTFVISASDLQAWLGAFGGGTYPPPSFANQGGPAGCP